MFIILERVDDDDMFQSSLLCLSSLRGWMMMTCFSQPVAFIILETVDDDEKFQSSLSRLSLLSSSTFFLPRKFKDDDENC